MALETLAVTNASEHLCLAAFAGELSFRPRREQRGTDSLTGRLDGRIMTAFLLPFGLSAFPKEVARPVAGGSCR